MSNVKLTDILLVEYFCLIYFYCQSVGKTKRESIMLTECIARELLINLFEIIEKNVSRKKNVQISKPNKLRTMFEHRSMRC